MDVLASFNLDELPEQQTRMMHLMERHPDFDLKLGFDACCACGKEFSTIDEGSDTFCPACKRVRYCSEICRLQDSQAVTSSTVVEGLEEQETAMGHTSVICALLCTCNDDEAAEENEGKPLNGRRLQAAKDRVRSEYESYPASLANVLAEGPCYQQVLQQCATKKKLTIHIIGASDDAELWFASQDVAQPFATYAEALADLAESRKLDQIELVFVGPDCSVFDVHRTAINSVQQDRSAGELITRTVKGIYTKELLDAQSVPSADIVVFFNPGFTVPDYDWKESLSSIDAGTPFLSTTNTELEGIADCQFLLDQDKIQSIPAGLADMFGLYSPNDEDEDVRGTSSFFSENPFSGMRIRQSGTMANDLFVKNRWMLGGIMDSFDASRVKTDAPTKRLKTGEQNSKASNPALI